MLDIFLVQLDSILSTDRNCKVKNFEKVRNLLQNVQIPANRKGLIILPEMFATGYIPKEVDAFAETFKDDRSSETHHFLTQLAKEKNCGVMGTGILRDGEKFYNHSGFYLPEEKAEVSGYNKRKPFFPELKRNFAAGEKVSLFRIEGWKIATAICFDLRFPELFRDAVKSGANLIVVQAAWPKIRKYHWETLLKARAIENQVYIAAVNGVSTSEVDPSKQLGGTSMIIDPQGIVLAQGNDFEESIVHAEINLEPLLKYRSDFPVLDSVFEPQKNSFQNNS